MTKIMIDDVSVNFRIYHDRSPSLKQFFADLFSRKKQATCTEFWAVKNISLEINSGDRVGIVGHNGAGKSTLLKAICRIYSPSEGKISVDGKIAPLLEIGAGFHPEFTGRENIYLNGSILGYNNQELKKLESGIISFAELEEFIDTPVKYYSTGMYTRLAFSVATAMKPEILILDEVFAGGDASFVHKATERIQSLIDAAKIIVFVSHDINIITRFCNRVIWLDHGKIKLDGETEFVVNKYLDYMNNK